MSRKHTNFFIAAIAVLMTGGVFAQDSHEKHAHDFAKDVDAFHAVLAPLWHAKAGKERSQKVCTQADKLEKLGRDIKGGDATPLVESLTALKVQCQENPTKIDAAFSKVHEAFHRLAEHEHMMGGK